MICLWLGATNRSMARVPWCFLGCLAAHNVYRRHTWSGAKCDHPIFVSHFWVTACHINMFSTAFEEFFLHPDTLVSLSKTKMLLVLGAAPVALAPKGSSNSYDMYPIGSMYAMYAIYGNIYHQYTPNVSIYTSTMDPMGIDMNDRCVYICL